MILKKKIRIAFSFVFGLIAFTSSVSQDPISSEIKSCETMPNRTTKSNRLLNVNNNGTASFQYELLKIYQNSFDVGSSSVLYESNCLLSVLYNFNNNTLESTFITFLYNDGTTRLTHSLTFSVDSLINHNLNCSLVIDNGNITFSVSNNDGFTWLPVSSESITFLNGTFEHYGFLSYDTILDEISNVKEMISSFGYDDGYDLGYQAGIDVGYHQGFDSGQNAVNQEYYQAGYTKGYDDATDRYADGSLSLNGILNAIVTAPSTIIKDGLDFDILGYNVGEFVMSLVVIGLIVYAIGFFKKG